MHDNEVRSVITIFLPKLNERSPQSKIIKKKC